MTHLYKITKNEAIIEITQELLRASQVDLEHAIKILETKYNPYHRVFYPFTVLFKRTSYREFKKLAPEDSIPETIFHKGIRVNINQILDNSYHYMKPLDKMAKECGFQGAYVEDKGISLTIPEQKLSGLLVLKYQEYKSWVKKFKVSKEKIQNMIIEILNFQNIQYYNHVKLTYSAEEFPPETFLHKLRRDLSSYYKSLGYFADVKNKDGSGIEKSCDFYFDNNVENYPGRKKPVILKIYFVPQKLPFTLPQKKLIKPEPETNYNHEKEQILKLWENETISNLFSQDPLNNKLTTIPDLITSKDNEKDLSFIEFIKQKHEEREKDS
jgi:hypothetical protein